MGLELFFSFSREKFSLTRQREREREKEKVNLRVPLGGLSWKIDSTRVPDMVMFLGSLSQFGTTYTNLR
jgi:hypothetical protein